MQKRLQRKSNAEEKAAQKEKEAEEKNSKKNRIPSKKKDDEVDKVYIEYFLCI